MPTLNAAQTATVSLTVPNAYITVDCSSGAVVEVSWVSAGSISGRRTVQNISEDVGPFTDQTVVTLYCRSGTASYSATGDQASQAAIQVLVSAAGNFTVNSRDGLGRATSYTDSSGTTFTVTYGSFGPLTVSGGGQTRTYAYNAAGQMTGYSAS